MLKDFLQLLVSLSDWDLTKDGGVEDSDSEELAWSCREEYVASLLGGRFLTVFFFS